jgi:organic hydroperoxide reductase OsmC/OhrA
MLGTLSGALEVRGIRLAPEAIVPRVEGVNEVRERIPVLTAIHVHYTLRVTAGSRDVVDRALATHQAKCPTAESLKGAVAVSWTADVTEA